MSAEVAPGQLKPRPDSAEVVRFMDRYYNDRKAVAKALGISPNLLAVMIAIRPELHRFRFDANAPRGVRR